MNLNNLEKLTKNRKRKGRGISAGQGKTAGRGTKGQKSRTGKKLRPGFEGGQLPLAHRLPKKRGFRSVSVKPQTVQLGRLNNLKDGTKVDLDLLRKEGLVRSASAKIVLGGDYSKKLIVAVPATKSAVKAIEEAGGKYEITKS